MLRHKYRARPVTIDNIYFPSTSEGRRYEELKILQKSGEVIFFLRQVPFALPGNITYRADFMVFWTDGNISIEDVKGHETREFITKKKQVEEIYPIEIQIIKYKKNQRFINSKG